ncbi:MAG: hypothetical protein HQ518_17430 [Rhodopirellula sp.]|nr:hypothetical protein [Rhodopirellula sp.]
MANRLTFPILPQPTDSTCGPTSLHAVYGYYGDDLPLEQVIDEVETVETGGTLAALLGQHALKRGYKATLYTCNLYVFDPTWFDPIDQPLVELLRAQMEFKKDAKLQTASQAYINFLQKGGRIRLEDMSPALLRRYLRRGIPVLTGLSLTWLYRDPRETYPESQPDNIRGLPVGHFVVLCGYDPVTRLVLVADPYEANPHAEGHHYEVPLERVMCAILLGVVTYDANMLIIERPDRSA